MIDPDRYAALVKENEDLKREKEHDFIVFLRAVHQAAKRYEAMLDALREVDAHARKVNWINDHEDERVLAIVRAAIAYETGKMP